MSDGIFDGHPFSRRGMKIHRKPAQPEGREPCPELAREMKALLLDGKIHAVNDTPYDAVTNFQVVPCLVTPLLTPSERERLVGEGQ